MRGINRPVNKGIARVPVVMQMEALECGAACLTMILAYYEKWVPLEQVRKDCGISRDGSNAANVLKAARHYGLLAQGYKMEPETLKQSGTFPCIVHWDFNHFIVVDGFKGDKVYVNDPARGAYTLSMETFDDKFTGIVIMFEPGDDFTPSGRKKSLKSLIYRRLEGARAPIIFTALTAALTGIVTAINPALSRVFLDKLLTGDEPKLIRPFFIVLLIFTLCQIIVSALNGVYNRRFQGKMEAIGSLSYLWKVLNLPMDFFSQRMAGDIHQRQLKNTSIANTLINTIAPLFFEVVLMVLYFIVMTNYSWKLTIVAFSSIAIDAVVARYIADKRVNILRAAVFNDAKLTSYEVSGIEMIESIKAAGAENGYFAKWAGYQADSNSQNVRYTKINAYLGMIPEFISSLTTYIVLVLGVYLTMKGEFTQGMILAFQGYLTAFMSPANTIITASQSIQETRTDMERIDDVMDYPDDSIIGSNVASEEAEYQKLSGAISIKNLSFGYSPLAEPLIKDFNLELAPGHSVAIVGPSACGKSTVSKLIGGLYRPWSGEIRFDGKLHSEIDREVFAASVAVVDQEIQFYDGTLADNIKMWDSNIEDFEMILAARDAQIHNDIMERTDGYAHEIRGNAVDFSGGQRQRIEIARVLAQDPTIVIMDEATSALDAKTEYELVKAIEARNISTVVIAHRLSTIRSCDEIIVMNKGEIVARGTHNELMKTSEEYRTLVTNE